MSICIVPDNQPIYQALLDKATFYSIHKVTNVEKKYTLAAEIIRKTRTNIYSIVDQSTNIWNFEEDIEDYIPNIGPSIISFIFDYAKENPINSSN
jgi:hypothetical protein